MSFRHSYLFWFVIITDILVSILLIQGLVSYFDINSGNFHKPEVLFMTLFSPLNLLVDIVLVWSAGKTPDTIDLRLSWFKALTGFLGGFTSISGLYFLIISYDMHHVYNQRSALFDLDN